MTWFMLAMIAYPEKQQKCQEELDRVVGRSRMPTFLDRNNLVYVRATVREILRWRTVTPVGETIYILMLLGVVLTLFEYTGVQHYTTEVTFAPSLICF